MKRLSQDRTGGRARGSARGRRAARVLVATLVLVVAVGMAAGSARLSEAAAESLAMKLNELTTPANPRTSPIVITENEANSYLKFRGGEFLPAGVHDPTLHIAPDIVSAVATVDFDRLGAEDSADPSLGARAFSLVFRGRQPVIAAGRLETSGGRGTLRVESLTVGATRIPPAFVQFLLESYVERRYGVDLSQPFPLPEGVTHIELGRGQATFHRAPLAAAR